jgi:hypothetical protein
MQNEYDDLIQSKPAAGNEYDEILRNQTASDARLGVSAKQASTTDPDRSAKIIQLSTRTGLPAPVVDRQFDAVKQQEKVREINEFDKIIADPAVKKWLTDENNLSLVQDDLENLGVMQWMLAAPKRAFGQGRAQVKLGRLRYKSLFGELTAEETQQLEAYRADMHRGGELAAESFPARALTGAARQLPQILGALYAGSQYGLTGAVAGGASATLAGQLGPQALVPEEIVTVPGAAALGYYAGHTVGAAEFGLVQEAGHAYDEFLTFKDSEGKPLDPAVAKIAALAAGGVNAGLEATAVNILMRSIPGLDKLVGAPGREVVKAALRQPTVQQAFLDLAKRYGGVLAKETAIEVAQRAVTIMAGEIGKVASGQDIEQITPEKFAQELVSEGRSALETFALLGLPGPSINFALDVQRARQAQVNSEFFKSLGETAEKSKLRERLPEKLQELAAQITADGPIENVYVEPTVFAEYFQGKNLDPREVAAEIFGSPEAFDQALVSGHDLQIPTAAYAAKIAGTEHNQFFTAELKFDPLGLNLRESKELEKQAQAEIERMQEEFKAQEGQEAPTVGSYITQQLEQAGYERSTAETLAQQMDAFFTTMAERLPQEEGQPKQTGWDLFKQYAIRILGKGVEPFQKPATELQQPKPVKEKQPTKFSFLREAFRRAQVPEQSQVPAVIPTTPREQAAPIKGPKMSRRDFINTARSVAAMQSPLGRVASAVAKLFGQDAVKELAGQATEAIVREVVRSVVNKSSSVGIETSILYSNSDAVSDFLTSSGLPEIFDDHEDVLAEDPALAKFLSDRGIVEYDGVAPWEKHKETGEPGTWSYTANRGEVFNALRDWVISNPDSNKSTVAKLEQWTGYDKRVSISVGEWSTIDFGGVRYVFDVTSYRGAVSPDEMIVVPEGLKTEITEFTEKRREAGIAYSRRRSAIYEQVIAEVTKTEPMPDRVNEPAAYGEFMDRVRDAVDRRLNYTPDPILSEDAVRAMVAKLAEYAPEWRSSVYLPEPRNLATQAEYDEVMSGSKLGTAKVVASIAKEAADAGFKDVVFLDPSRSVASFLKNAGATKLEQAPGPFTGASAHQLPTEGFKFPELTLDQPAWHGSGHIFEKFDISKIGIGEGAQVHGWGLYFAKIKQTAAGYKQRHGQRTLSGLQEAGYGNSIPSVLEDNTWLDALTRAKTSAERRELVEDKLSRMKDRLRTAEQTLTNEMKLVGISSRDQISKISGKLGPGVERALNRVDFLTEGVTLLETVLAQPDPKVINTGRLYEVNVLAEDNEMLDLEASLPNWEQPWGETEMSRLRKEYDTASSDVWMEAMSAGDTDLDYVKIMNIIVVLERIQKGEPVTAAQQRMADAWTKIEQNQTTKDLDEEFQAKMAEWGQLYPQAVHVFEGDGAEVHAKLLWGKDMDRVIGVSDARLSEMALWVGSFNHRRAQRQQRIEESLYPNDQQNELVWKLLQTKEMQDLMVTHDIETGRDLYKAIVRELKNPRYRSMSRATASLEARSAEDSLKGERIKTINYEEANDNGKFYVNILTSTPDGDQRNAWHGRLDVNDLKYLFPAEIAQRMLNLEGRPIKDGDDLIAYEIEPGNWPFKSAWRDPMKGVADEIVLAQRALNGKHVNDLIYAHGGVLGTMDEHVYMVKATGPNSKVIYERVLDEETVGHIFGNEVRLMMNAGIDHGTERSLDPEEGDQRSINLNRPIKIDLTVLTPEDQNNLTGRIREIAEVGTFNGVPSMSPEETASRYLLANGIKGLNYVGGTDGPAMVVFADDLIEITGYEQKEGTRGKLLKYGDYEYDIQLFENADLSTFLHESGHLYLEIMKNMAKDSPAVAKDLGVILKWMGVESADRIQVEHHEKFARGIEAYFMEGKAPNAGLRTAFARFRTWLLALYRKLTSLDVKLNDEIREVMDRMFATDAEIEAARREGQVDQIFMSAEQAGMRPEEFERYRETVAKANQTATEELQTRLMLQFKRYQEQWWKEQRRIVREEVREDYNARPDVVAYNLLRLGRDPEGNELPEPQRIKLDIHEIGQMYGRDSETFRAMRSMNMVRGEGGTHPNIAAQILGFQSGDHLVKSMLAIRNYKDRVEQETDRIMKERYGDALTDGTLHEQARAAIANTDHAKVLHAELKALTALRNKVAPFVQEERNRQQAETTQGLATVRGIPPLETFQRLAKARIAAMPVRSITPHQFLVAARKAGTKAVDEAAKNNFQEAAYLKQQELFNLELYREATKAREFVDQTVEYAASLTSKTVRQRLGRAGDQYLEQVDALLERFSFAPVTNRELDRRSNLRDWVDNQRRAGVEVDIDERLLDAAFRTSYKDMTYEQLQGVSDALHHIEHMSKLKNKLLKSKGKRDLQAVLDDLDASIRSNKSHSTPEKTGLRLPQGELKRFADAFFAAHRKLASYARQFDGFKDGGPFWQYIIRPINEASDNEATAIHKAGQALQKVFAPYMTAGEALKSAGTTLTLGLISQGMYAKTFISAVGMSFSKMERLLVALNMGTDDNYEKLKNGYGWNDDQVQAIVDDLTAEDWKFVQGVWDHLNSYWPAVEAKEKRVNGIAPPKVESRPVTTKFGEMRGGYFPLKYEDRLSPQAYGDRAKEAADMAMRGAYTRATTKRGHTKTRVEGVKMPVRLDFGVIFEHVHQVIHDLSFHETLIDMNKILGSRQIQKAIIENYGDIVYKQIQDAITDTAAGEIPADTAFEKSVTWLRHGVSVAAMGWNLSTALLQPLGLSQSIVRIGAPWVFKGVSRLLGGAVRMENTVKWVHAKSEFMHNRFNTYNREINEIRNTVRGQTSMSAVADTYFWLIMKFQTIADLPTWLGMYEKQMAIGAEESTAIALADQAVLDSQGGGQVKDMAQIQRGGPLMKMWTNFYSYFNVTYNLTAESIRRTEIKDPLSIGRLAVDLLLLYTVPAVLGFLIKEGLRGDEEDDLVGKLAAEQAGYILGSMVGFREFSSVVQGFYGYSGPTGTRFYSEAVKVIQRAQEDQYDAQMLKTVNQAAGILFHYPAGQVQRTLDGYVAMSEGDASPSALLFGPPRESK